jgi:hypothetical protein
LIEKYARILNGIYAAPLPFRWKIYVDRQIVPHKLQNTEAFTSEVYHKFLHFIAVLFDVYRRERDVGR